jgi:alkylation response protein AidB-like acyl-CoA dehydrogenase
MDFSFSDEQDALRSVAEQVFAGGTPVERLKAIEASDERMDRVLWRKLADANLLGVAIAEDHGGIGFGLVELAIVAEQQGRNVAPVPLAATLGRAALPLARFGSEVQQAQWLPRIADGSAILTGAYAERGANVATARSSVRAARRGDAWELTGTKIAVPAMNVADAVLVPAQHDDGSLTVFVVDAATPGVGRVDAITTNREKHATVTFDAATVGDDAVLGGVGQGGEVLAWTLPRLSVLHSAIALGACETALAMAAAYTSQRVQFGRPLSTNQGVALRAADAYIDIDAMRVTLWQAAWRIDAGLDAAMHVEVAQYWASEAGQRVVHATQHLHGGMGADVDYPVHRTFLWVKQFENLLGGGSQHLARLGSRIAAEAKAAAAQAGVPAR